MTDKRCLLSYIQELRDTEAEEGVYGFRQCNRRDDRPKFELKKRKWLLDTKEKMTTITWTNFTYTTNTNEVIDIWNLTVARWDIIGYNWYEGNIWNITSQYNIRKWDGIVLDWKTYTYDDIKLALKRFHKFDL